MQIVRTERAAGVRRRIGELALRGESHREAVSTRAFFISLLMTFTFCSSSCFRICLSVDTRRFLECWITSVYASFTVDICSQSFCRQHEQSLWLQVDDTGPLSLWTYTAAQNKPEQSPQSFFFNETIHQVTVCLLDFRYFQFFQEGFVPCNSTSTWWNTHGQVVTCPEVTPTLFCYLLQLTVVLKPLL